VRNKSLQRRDAFCAPNWPTQNAPFPGLLMHFTIHCDYHCRTPTKGCVSVYLGCLRVPITDHTATRRSCKRTDHHEIDFRTGYFLSPPDQTLYAMPIQIHTPQTVLNTTLLLTRRCSVPPSSILPTPDSAVLTRDTMTPAPRSSSASCAANTARRGGSMHTYAHVSP